MSALFRSEAIDHAANRLAGNVILAVPLSVRLLGLGFAALVLAALTFAATATYARKATVTGWLLPDRGMVRVAAQSAGSVGTMLVTEGAMVKAGDRIAEVTLSSHTSAGDVGAVVAEGLAAETEAARARAAGAIDKLEHEDGELAGSHDNVAAQLQQARAQAALQTQRLALAKQEAARSETLATQGLLSRRDLSARQTAALSVQEELAGQTRQIMVLERDLATIAARQAAIPLEIKIARADAETAEAGLRQRVAEAQSRNRLFVTAPIDGRVAALPVSAGQSVSAGTTMAIIMPAGSTLEAELLAPSRAAGFVAPGQEVRLQLQAFPHQRFGSEHGVIRSVSATVLAPSEVSIPGIDIREPIFRVRVSLVRDYVEAYGARVPLQPGMLLSADIVFDRRSLIEWLFDPIFAVRH